MRTIDLGRVTAYADAVAAGYTGTREQFATDLANAANYAGEAGESEEAAAESAWDSEAYAVGTRGGAAVASDDPAYHNNAKYYSDQAHDDASDAKNYKDDAYQSKQDANDSAGNASTDALKSEGYALGKQAGADVPSGSPYYHNNSKYYSDQAGQSAQEAGSQAGEAEAWATGEDVEETDPQYHNNSKYYSEQASGSAGTAANKADNAAASALVSEGYAVGKQNGAAVASGSPYYQNNASYYASQAAASAAMSAAMTGLAPAFSTSTAYSAGDYVLYNGTLYRFTSAHAAGAWTGSDAVAATLAPDVSSLKSEINTEEALTRETLSLVDAYDTVDILPWEQGSLSNGAPTNSSIRVRTSGFVPIDAEFIVIPNSGYKVAVNKYTDKTTESYTGEVAFFTTIFRITTATANYVKFLVAKTDNSAITPPDANNACTIIKRDKLGTAIRSVEYVLANSEDILYKEFGVKIIDPNIFEVATATVSNNTITFSHSTQNRVVNTTPINLKMGCIITLDDFSEATMYVNYNRNGTWGNSGWVTEPFVCPTDGDYYILLESVPTDTQDNVFLLTEKLSIYDPYKVNYRKKEIQSPEYALYDYYVGSINNDGSDNYVGKTRVRTGYMRVNKGDTIQLPLNESNFYFEIVTYGESVTVSSFMRQYYADNNAVIRVVFRKNDGSSNFTNDNIAALKTELRYTKSPKNNYENRVAMRSINHAGWYEAPENTLAGFLAAYNHGFRAQEFDCRLTSDNVWVCLHDASINRTARTSTGEVITDTINVGDVTYNSLLAYDFGIYKGQEYAGEKIPKVDDAVKMMKALDVSIYLDIATYPTFTREQLFSLVDIIADNGMLAKTTFVCTGDYGYWLSSAYPDANLCVVSNAANWIYVACALSGRNSVFLDAQLSTVTAEKIENAKSRNVPMEVWTVTTTAEIDSLDDYITGVTSPNIVAQEYLKGKYVQ